MVSILKRMRKLKSLLDMRIGEGAAVFPGEVRKLHLHFARKINGGHFGARKFWRLYLPRLKYHNPAVSMTVSRHSNQEDAATLTIFFAKPSDPTSTSTPPPPSSSAITTSAPLEEAYVERTEVIEMKHEDETNILASVLQLTKAVPVNATAEELAEMQQLKEEKERGKQDQLRNAKLNEQKRQEKALLEQARGVIAATEA